MKKSVLGLISTRFVIGVMLFTSCFVTYTMRVNMSINIIAMVEPARTNGSLTEPDCVIVNRISNNETLGNESAEKLTSVPEVST